MGNIAVRKQNGDKPAVNPSQQPSGALWDPWRRMRALLEWDPFAEMAPLSGAEAPISFSAAFDVKETKDAYLFKADVPGIQDKDLEVTITGNRLTVAGKREEEKEEKNDRYYTYERNFGSFTRSFTLPEGADTDHLQAALEKGVLSITLPKKPEVQAKKIEVKSEGQNVKS